MSIVTWQVLLLSVTLVSEVDIHHHLPHNVMHLLPHLHLRMVTE